MSELSDAEKSWIASRMVSVLPCRQSVKSDRGSDSKKWSTVSNGAETDKKTTTPGQSEKKQHVSFDPGRGREGEGRSWWGGGVPAEGEGGEGEGGGPAEWGAEKKRKQKKKENNSKKRKEEKRKQLQLKY